MIDRLVRIADRLDQKGREDLADEIDKLIREESGQNKEEVTDEDIETLWEENADD